MRFREFGRIENARIPAGAFCRIHRKIGVNKEILIPRAVARVQCSADTDAHTCVIISQIEGIAKRFDHTASNRGHRLDRA